MVCDFVWFISDRGFLLLLLLYQYRTEPKIKISPMANPSAALSFHPPPPLYTTFYPFEPVFLSGGSGYCYRCFYLMDPITAPC